MYFLKRRLIRYFQTWESKHSTLVIGSWDGNPPYLTGACHTSLHLLLFYSSCDLIFSPPPTIGNSDYWDFLGSFTGEGFSLLINLAEGGVMPGTNQVWPERKFS